METTREGEHMTTKNGATVERKSERELVVTRTVDGPARLVYQAWTQPDLMMRWWAPRSFPMKLLSCEQDVRVGGKYRLVFDYQGTKMEFFGAYLEVSPASRLVWTNEEADGPGPVTTVTFEEKAGKTLVVVHDLYPSKEALDAAIASGSTSGMPAQLEQLNELLVTLARA
jgi:uncharacterized protein YndB with AHSA1/START domain